MGDFSLSVDPKPINGGVLVRMIGGSHRTTAGIYLPETASSYPMQGKVVEISPGWFEGGVFRDHYVAIGDVVIFNWKAGFDLILDNKEFRIIQENDIIAILRGVDYGEESR